MADTDASSVRILWARVLVEGLVIVGSILLALAVDEWWESRELEEAEMAILERLAHEFDENEAQFERKAGEHREVLVCGEALLEVTGSQARGELPVDSLSTLLWNFLRTSTYDPADGVLNSLITSGEIGIITNPDLRTALAGWPSLVKDLKEDEDAAWTHRDDVIFPFMNDVVSFRSLHLSKNQEQFQRPSDFPDGLRELLRNREFENIVASRLVSVESGIIPALRAIEVGLDSIRTLIASEINR
ncbi:hypothetical protein ACFL0I_02605 [Gemmatimonadota bacterium]